jgi:methionyl-tRNA formyltransferase
MKIYIIGQKWMGCEVIKMCIKEGYKVVGVAAPAGDKMHEVARVNGIESVTYCNRIYPEFIPDGIDLIIAAHAHVYINALVRARARLGAIGYHPSLLPNHRGKDSIEQVINNKELVTGGTVFFLDDSMDTGDIILQDWCHVRQDDDARSLWMRELAPMGLRLLSESLQLIQLPDFVQKKQDESLAT